MLQEDIHQLGRPDHELGVLEHFESILLHWAAPAMTGQHALRELEDTLGSSGQQSSLRIR